MSAYFKGLLENTGQPSATKQIEQNHCCLMLKVGKIISSLITFITWVGPCDNFIDKILKFRVAHFMK